MPDANAVLLILARGGSKGIPKKNLQLLQNEPLITRCVRICLASQFKKTYLYSDSEEILLAGKDAITIKRPEEVSGDDISTEDTVNYFLKHHDKKKQIRTLGVVQCTTPFLTPHYLNCAYNEMQKCPYDAIATGCAVQKYLGYPSTRPSCKFVPFFPYRALRQSMRKTYFMENGGLYLARRNIWESGRRYGVANSMIEMQWWESLEIDEPLDLEIARAMAPVIDQWRLGKIK